MDLGARGRTRLGALKELFESSWKPRSLRKRGAQRFPLVEERRVIRLSTPSPAEECLNSQDAEDLLAWMRNALGSRVSNIKVGKWSREWKSGLMDQLQSPRQLFFHKT